MRHPLEILHAENKAIAAILEVLEEICFLLQSDQEILRLDLVSIADFLDRYVEQFHNGKENLLLYPTLESAGLLKGHAHAANLLREHDTGKGFITELNVVTACASFVKEDFIQHAESYIAHMRQHIKTEEKFLLPLAEQLPASVREKLAGDFQEWEANGLGVEASRDFQRLIGYFQDKYLKNR